MSPRRRLPRRARAGRRLLTRFIGLTGGIGAGKSEALAALDRLGAQTLSTDAVTHEILNGDEMRDLLVERWGERVAPNGVVDRDAIASLVFENPDELKWLESEMHPGSVEPWPSGAPGSRPRPRSR